MKHKNHGKRTMSPIRRFKDIRDDRHGRRSRISRRFASLLILGSGTVLIGGCQFSTTVSPLGNGFAPSGPPQGIPVLMNVTDNIRYSGLWRWNGHGYDASWNNGALANLSITHFTPASVVIERVDTPKSATAGFRAVYTGQIAAGGNAIVHGTSTLMWPGHPGYPTTGTWSASWNQP